MSPQSFIPIHLLLQRDQQFSLGVEADTPTTSFSAQHINLGYLNDADQIRATFMLNFLAVDNQMSVEVLGYRNTSTRVLIGGATITASIYDTDDNLVSTITLTDLTNGDYRGTLSGNSLVAGNRYKLVISHSGYSRWTRWFYAQDRPTIR